jgi:hypothetical protein
MCTPLSLILGLPSPAPRGSCSYSSNCTQGIPGLRVLRLDRCWQLQRVELRSCPGLRVAEVDSCGDLITVEMKGANSLEQLYIRNCRQYREGLSGSEQMVSLKLFEVDRCGQLERLDLGGLRALEELKIGQCGTLRGVAGLGRLGALKRMEVEECGRLTDLQVGGLKALENLRISECDKLRAVAGLRELGALTLMDIDCGEQPLLDLRGLAALRTLRIGFMVDFGVPTGRVVGLGDLRSLSMWAVSNLDQHGLWRNVDSTGDSTASLHSYLIRRQLCAPSESEWLLDVSRAPPDCVLPVGSRGVWGLYGGS